MNVWLGEALDLVQLSGAKSCRYLNVVVGKKRQTDLKTNLVRV